MNSGGLSIDARNQHENEFSEFLLKRIGRAGGTLKLQHITGHLSQLSNDIRCSIGTSKADLLCFFKKRKNLFSLNGDDVSIIDSSSKDENYDSDSSSIEQHQPSLPVYIKEGKGVITKVFPKFGFIKVKEPLKTDVYFCARSFGDENADLTGLLYVGTMVYFDAKKKNDNDARSKYKAIKVWKVNENYVDDTIVVKKSRKDRSTGEYDPMTLDSEGIIQNLFPNLGFISVKGDESNTVFFHKNRLVNFENIVDLTKVLSKGDIVEFNAHRSTKQDAKARWEATKVWKKSGKIKRKHVTAKSDSGHSSLAKIDVNNGNSSKEMIKSQCGKICPRSQGAVIKFGENELADGDAAVYYISGSQVNDISWEFSEGDNVYFDAVKIKSAPGWKAVLVWVGDRPDFILPTCLGDFSEFTDEETEDNRSSYMSNSSNSSIKSVSLKSDSNSSKIREFKNENSSRSSNFTVNREVRKCKKGHKMHDSTSQYDSQSSLNSSVTSTSSQRSRKESKKENPIINKVLKAENKSLSSWGDSPYPAGENHQNISPSDSNVCDLSMKFTQSKIIKVPNEEVQSLSRYSNTAVEKKKINKKNEDYEFSGCQEIMNEKKLCSEFESDMKDVANIRKYEHVEGKIIKVYSKFAEVKASKLQNTVSFFWNNFYFNGKSVEQLELDDLRQILKVEDTIHFNYFEIIDDSGQNWQKVSLAWNNSKPTKVIEIHPEEFIKQNNLSVSLKRETTIDHIEDKVISRKFLKAIDVSSPYVSETESCSEDELPTSADHVQEAKQPSVTLSPVVYKMVSNAIIQILKNGLLLHDSKVDFNSISNEIINAVLENNNAKGCDDEFQQVSTDENYMNITSHAINACADCGKISVSNSYEMNTKNSEAQTIITGEIIAQNIFTEC